MFARRLRTQSLVFACLDVLLTLAAFLAAYDVRSWLLPALAPYLPGLPPLPLYPLGSYLPLLVAIVLVWPAAGSLLGVYRPRQLQEHRQALWEPTKLVAGGMLALGAGLFFAKGVYVSRLLLVGFVLFDWFFLVAARLSWIHWGDRWRQLLGGDYYILLVGTGKPALELARLIEDSARAGLRLVGFVDPKGNHPMGRGEALEKPVWTVADVPRLLQERVVDELIFAVSKEELGSLEDLLLRCEEEGVRTRVQLQVFPHLTSKVHLDQLRHVPLLTFSTTPENELHLLVKRLADVAGAAALLLVSWPILLLLAAAVRISSPGPALYRQIRCGLGGRRFSLYKFRSMVADADERRDELAALNEADGPVFKIRNDPRCTPLGRWMRRFSLDELPQLWNVLKGDMSFVGPRPPLPEEVENYERWQRRRLRMRPGLTCLWALEGRSRLSFERWMRLDLDYIDNWSLWLDLKIFLKTIPLVLSGRGAA
jgi:exopolysaccharide biosynthesis polyprenyl glycosylphosphotransferase